MRVFFYGLFMDERLLAVKGIKPSDVNLGVIHDYALRIGERATLVRRPESQVYGAVMDIAPDEAAELYAEDSVADYLPEPVIVELLDGTRIDAACYILPGDKVTGANRKYAGKLLDVATRLNFPDSYLEQIRRAQS